MNYRADQALRKKSKIIRIGQELMKLLRFFIALSLFLADWRISTDQRLRKEWLDHDDCVELIVMGLGFVVLETDISICIYSKIIIEVYIDNIKILGPNKESWYKVYSE